MNNWSRVLMLVQHIDAEVVAVVHSCDDSSSHYDEDA